MQELDAASTEGVDEIEVVEEVDGAIEVEVGGDEVGAEGVDEIEIVEEILHAITIEICGAVWWKRCPPGTAAVGAGNDGASWCVEFEIADDDVGE